MSDTESSEEDNAALNTLAFEIDPVKLEESELETCVIEAPTDFDDYSNVGSMMSVQSEEIVSCVDDTDNSSEYLLPDILSPEENSMDPEKESDNLQNEVPPKMEGTGSWPTLEILPGGVIKNADKFNNNQVHLDKTREKIESNCKVLLYSCGKCSESFKHLHCLVQHVKGHEIRDKIPDCILTNIITDVPEDHEYITTHRNKRKIITKGNRYNKMPKTNSL